MSPWLAVPLSVVIVVAFIAYVCVMVVAAGKATDWLIEHLGNEVFDVAGMLFTVGVALAVFVGACVWVYGLLTGAAWA